MVFVFLAWKVQELTHQLESLFLSRLTVGVKSVFSVSHKASQLGFILRVNFGFSVLGLQPPKLKFVLFFIKFLFFTKWQPFKKLWKMFFISSKKLFLFSRYSIFYKFLPFLFTLLRLKMTNGSRIIHDVMNWPADVVFAITQKLFHITPSNLVR